MSLHNFARRYGCGDEAFIHRAEHFLQHLWLPGAQTDGILPQDDSFLSKPVIDLAMYKTKAGKQTILLDYSRAEVNEMQILKQADVVMLMYMLSELFTPVVCQANLNFYERRTIHDSSLSKAIHGIVAARCGNTHQGYQFWRDGARIDLGDDPHSCDDGIHAAATGAIWLGAIQGFAGLNVCNGELHLHPQLPEEWQKLTFPLCWQGSEITIALSQQSVHIESSSPVTLFLKGTPVTVVDKYSASLTDFISAVNGTATTHKEDE